MTGSDELVVLAWNAHLGNRRVDRGLDALTVDTRPHAIALNEVPFVHDQIREWAARNDYRMLAEAPGSRRGTVVSERGSTIALVARGAPLLKARVVSGRRRWLVRSKRRWHTPRRDWRLRLRVGGQVYRGFFSHVATGGPDSVNGPAVREWLRRVRRALRVRPPWVVTVDVGDHNNRPGLLRSLIPGARVKGRGPDSIIAAGARVRHEVLGKHGSDHHAHLYILTPTRTTRRATRLRRRNRKEKP